jgi:ABC-2 type transport system ATP-binding protein
MSISINVEGLEKIYPGASRGEPSVHALKPLTLSITAGEIFGLLGPNGAGKTTLVKLLLGIVFPTSGSGAIFDKEIGSVASKEIAGYLPENHRYPNYLTGEGVLRYFGHLSGVGGSLLEKRITELLELVNMTKWRTTRVKKYSKGMMQRLGLAQALVNDPKLIFLDEPTDGVDPVGRREIREILSTLRARGKTIFLNSHLLSEVEMVCDRVAILYGGELVRIGTVQELTQSDNRYRVEAWSEQASQFARAVARFSPIEIEGAAATLELADISRLNACIDYLRSEGILLTGVSPVRRSLENLFFDIVKTGGKP